MRNNRHLINHQFFLILKRANIFRFPNVKDRICVGLVGFENVSTLLLGARFFLSD